MGQAPRSEQWRGQDRGSGGTRSGGGGRGNEREVAPTIDVSLVRFGKLDPKLFSDVAQACARAVGGRWRDDNKPSQLRRFYDELVSIQTRVGSDTARLEAQLPFIQMLKAKVAYAKGRKRVDANFEALLGKVVDQIVDVETLKQAKLFMEAFMGFYKVEGPKD